MQTWFDCGQYDNTSHVVAAAPEGRECVVVITAKIAPGAGEADRKAVKHILESFEVDCGRVTSEALAPTSASPSPTATAPPSATSSPSPDSLEATAAPGSASASAQVQTAGPAYNFIEVPRGTPPCPLGLDEVRATYGPNITCGEGGGYVPSPSGR